MNEIETVSEVAKNASSMITAFWGIIETVVPGIGIGKILPQGHAKLIESYVMRDDIDEDTKMMFIAMYKKRYKEIVRCSKVAKDAEGMIEPTANVSKVSEDWFDFFFDKVKNVSEEKAQNMWSQILAGEVNEPGTFSRSLIHALSIMDIKQAEYFCNLARFCLREYRREHVSKRVHSFVFIDANPEYYKHFGITYEMLKELENIGLIRCSFERELVFSGIQYISYGNHRVEIRGNEANAYKIKAGNVCLTSDGEALYRIIGEEYKEYSAQILDFIISELGSRGCKVYDNDRLRT